MIYTPALKRSKEAIASALAGFNIKKGIFKMVTIEKQQKMQ
jgi:hypothetical protein